MMTSPAEHTSRLRPSSCWMWVGWRMMRQRNIILATTQLQLGDVEAAAATGQLVVTDAWRLHSNRVHSELAGLVRAIEGCGSTAATDFVQQARELLAARSA